MAVFQPHLYSRTQNFYEDFARSFFQADVLVVTDVYPAREEPIEGVSGALIADTARRFGHREVHYEADKSRLAEYVFKLLKPGDLVLTIGAGDIWKTGRALVDMFEKQGKAGKASGKK